MAIAETKKGFVPYIKWPLLIIVGLLIVLNYYALKEVTAAYLELINGAAKEYGYNFDLAKPFFYLSDLVPGIALVSYWISSKNVLIKLQHVYSTVTIPQLLTLIILLPILLFVLNRHYGKLLKYGSK